MSFTLLASSAKMLKLKSESKKEVISMLEELLAEAKSGGITGVAGVFTTIKDERGTFYAGECCKRVDQTIVDLYALQSEI